MQVTAVKQELKRYWPVETDASEVAVNTVDSFQGAEHEIILLATTRVTSEGFRNSVFFNDERRVNVALTRAKRHLFIFGDCKALGASPMWKRVINVSGTSADKKRFDHKRMKDAMEDVQYNLNAVGLETAATPTTPPSSHKSPPTTQVSGHDKASDDDDFEQPFAVAASHQKTSSTWKARRADSDDDDDLDTSVFARGTKRSKAPAALDSDDSDDDLDQSIFSKKTKPAPPSSSSASSTVAPEWNFQCVREQENSERERIKRMGSIPAFDADIQKLADNYGKMAADGKAYLATLSEDSDDDEELVTVLSPSEVPAHASVKG
jgi:ATP-dependent exoDNAse (exonuclease V) beta subunit